MHIYIYISSLLDFFLNRRDISYSALLVTIGAYFLSNSNSDLLPPNLTSNLHYEHYMIIKLYIKR